MLLNILLVAAMSVFSFGYSSGKVLADGNDTLGEPDGITIQSGTGIVAAGVGLANEQPGTITIDVPLGAVVKQVLLYWSGSFETVNPADDTTIIIDDTEVTGSLIGKEVLVTRTRLVYRVDITLLGKVTSGTTSHEVKGLEYDINNGAGLLVIYDDGSRLANIDIRDGLDFAYHKFDGSLKTTDEQTFTFPASGISRTATLAMFFSSVSGSASGGGFRPSAINVTVDGSTTVYDNLLDSIDGDEWDTQNLDVIIPAGATNLSVQAFSVDNLSTGDNPTSFVWLTAGLSVPGVDCPKKRRRCGGSSSGGSSSGGSSSGGCGSSGGWGSSGGSSGGWGSSGGRSSGWGSSGGRNGRGGRWNR